MCIEEEARLYGVDEKHKAFFDELPPRKELPQAVQEFLGNLEGLDLVEKLALVHEFTLGYIEPVLQGPDDDIVPFETLLAERSGDCDDYAMFSAALLHYAGVPQQQVMYVGGLMTYSLTKGDGETNEASVRHAFLAVKTSNAQERYLILDNNAEGVFEVSEDIRKADIRLFNPFGQAGADGTAEVSEIFRSVLSDGQIVKVSKAPDAATDAEPLSQTKPPAYGPSPG